MNVNEIVTFDQNGGNLFICASVVSISCWFIFLYLEKVVV